MQVPESHLRFELVVLNRPYTSVLLNILQITLIHLEHILLPGESHGQSSLAGNSPWGCKESDTAERLSIAQHLVTAKPHWGFPRGSIGKEPACQCRRHKRYGFHPWVGKSHWSRKQQPTPIFLPGKFHGQRSLAGYNAWGLKELDTAEQLSD